MKNEKTRIHVYVKDLEQNPYSKASVKVRMEKTDKWQDISYNKTFQKFIKEGLKPDKYQLRVQGSQDLKIEERDLELSSGDKYVFVTLAPPNTRYYLAVDREKVYIEEDKEQIILYGKGKDLHRKLPLLLQKIGLELGKKVPRRKKNARSNSGSYFISLPKSLKEREKVISEIQKTIDKEFKGAGLAGKLALPMRRGKNIIEGLTNELIVKFQPEVSKDKVQELAKINKFQIIQKIKYLGNAYLWRSDELLSYDLLDIALELENNRSIIFAEPVIVFQIESDELEPYEPNDFLFPEQTHYRVIKAGEAWTKLGGLGNPDITIAVIDQGAIDPRHPDFDVTLTDGNKKLLANYDFNNSDFDLNGPRMLTADVFPSNLREDNHGTQCASSAAGASDNNLGAVGLAGNCSLIGARIGEDVSAPEICNVWAWSASLETGDPQIDTNLLAKGADVISNSWNWINSGLRSLECAVEKLTSEGRNGKGCVICFSISNDGYSDFVSNHPYLVIDGLIKVGASINENPTNVIPDDIITIPGDTGPTIPEKDKRAYYSPYGDILDIVAPSSTAFSFDLRTIDPILSAVIKNRGNMIGPEKIPNINPTNLIQMIYPNPSGNQNINVGNSTAFSPGLYAMVGELIGYSNREFLYVADVNSNSDNQITLSLVQKLHHFGTKIYVGERDYSKGFGGTSHACATVAGAAALILSVNPALTWIQVRDILRSTADKIDFNNTNSIGKWVDKDDDGVKEFSQWYGYGRLNVYNAVKSAEGITFYDRFRDRLRSLSRFFWRIPSPA
jgi:subtilisin family serine protease